MVPVIEIRADLFVTTPLGFPLNSVTVSRGSVVVKITTVVELRVGSMEVRVAVATLDEVLDVVLDRVLGAVVLSEATVGEVL